ncbi:hypothetical protein KJ359_010449 [Pestalotiopsis sp. 9143b]|nr:hypothetical protein KJ359_010449 [Pestalotiopsis sp. 9143b]
MRLFACQSIPIGPVHFGRLWSELDQTDRGTRNSSIVGYAKCLPQSFESDACSKSLAIWSGQTICLIAIVVQSTRQILKYATQALLTLRSLATSA